MFDELSNGMFSHQKQNKIQLPKSPPCDCVLSEEGDLLTLEFAMAGYSKKDITVTANPGTLTLKAVPPESIDEGDIVVHQGISKKKVDITLAIDDQYDAKKAKVDFSEGMLEIAIPRKKEAESVKLL